MQGNIAKFEITYPNVMDNEFVYWKALRNQYWPTVYLIGKKGFIRARHIGETHGGTPEARSVEAFIERLLAEEVG